MAGRYVAGKLQIVGLEEVVRELEARRLDVMAGVEAICQAGAQVVHQEITGRSPSIGVAAATVRETIQRTPTKVTVGVGPTKGMPTRIARWMEFGTKAHTLPKARKRRRKVLKMPDGSFRRSVPHPGTKKRPFIRPGYDASAQGAANAMAAKTKVVVRG